MTGEIIKFHPVEIGDGYRFDPDEVLESAKGQAFDLLVIIGVNAEGMQTYGNANAGESLILMERAKHYVVFGDED